MRFFGTFAIVWLPVASSTVWFLLRDMFSKSRLLLSRFTQNRKSFILFRVIKMTTWQAPKTKHIQNSYPRRTYDFSATPTSNRTTACARNPPPGPERTSPTTAPAASPQETCTTSARKGELRIWALSVVMDTNPCWIFRRRREMGRWSHRSLPTTGAEKYLRRVQGRRGWGAGRTRWVLWRARKETAVSSLNEVLSTYMQLQVSTNSCGL